jgi:hypothetical protein
MAQDKEVQGFIDLSPLAICAEKCLAMIGSYSISNRPNKQLSLRLSPRSRLDFFP